MMDELGDLLLSLSKLSDLSQGFVTVLSGKIRRYTFKKGSPLKDSTRAQSVWFVQSGMLKGSWFDQDGKEYVSRFWKENEFVMINPTAFEQIYSADYLIMLEDTVLLCLSSKDAEHLVGNFSEASRIAGGIIMKDRDQAELLAYLLRLPLKQAYEKFERLYPANRIPIQDIARFLNVSPKRISEVRALR